MKRLILLTVMFILLCSVKSDSISWVQKAYFGGGQRMDAASFSINGIGYVGTGNANRFVKSYTSSFYSYEPNSDVWSSIEPLPSHAKSRAKATGFSIGNKGYVCGGEKYVLYGIDFFLDDFWEYNPETNLWYQRKDFPRGIIRGTGFSIGNKGYVGLGLMPDWEETNTFYEYDPSTNQWIQLNDFPGAPRCNSVGFSYNGKGYIGLGYDFQNDFVYFNDLWEYNPSDDSWKRLSDFPGDGRTSAIGFGIDNCLYIGMGEPNDFYKYDLSTEKWEFSNYLPGSARNNGYSFCLDKKIFYGGGKIVNGDLLSDSWCYNTSKMTDSKEIFTNNKVKVYPIPTYDKLNIDIDSKINKIEIFDNTGKCVKIFSNSKNCVDIHDLKKGTYIISIFTQNKKVHQQNFLKIE